MPDSGSARDNHTDLSSAPVTRVGSHCRHGGLHTEPQTPLSFAILKLTLKQAKAAVARWSIRGTTLTVGLNMRALLKQQPDGLVRAHTHLH